MPDLSEFCGVTVAVRRDDMPVRVGVGGRVVLLPKVELGAVDRSDVGLAGYKSQEDVVESEVLRVRRPVMQVEQGGA